jgi:hypothetical protein
LVTTTDDDTGNIGTAGFTIMESGGGTSVSESGTTDTFDVVLDGAPASDVVILVTSGNTGEAIVDQAWLTFTPADWDIPQIITVTGIDDAIVDGTQTTAIILSVDDANSDDDFDSLADQTVLVTTTDDDDDGGNNGTAGFTIMESGGGTNVAESGTTDTFDVVLDTAPGTNVVILVTSDDTAEVTSDQAWLTFTPADWDIPQTVTVTGIDDAIVDGNQTTAVILSVDDINSDDAFDSLAAQAVLVTTIDDGIEPDPDPDPDPDPGHDDDCCCCDCCNNGGGNDGGGYDDDYHDHGYDYEFDGTYYLRDIIHDILYGRVPDHVYDRVHEIYEDIHVTVPAHVHDRIHRIYR